MDKDSSMDLSSQAQFQNDMILDMVQKPMILNTGFAGNLWFYTFTCVFMFFLYFFYTFLYFFILYLVFGIPFAEKYRKT